MSFSEVRHQDRAVAALERILAADRVPHGFIFCGPHGVGKALTARALARVLLCDAPKRGRGKGAAPAACGKCPQCRLVDRGSHPDLTWFRKSPEKTEFTIDLITRRDKSPDAATVNESVQLKPMQARSRVTVIEDAEVMNDAAANAFLKTFEEAPDGSYLILLVTTLDRLLPTIRSRGRLIRFGSLPAGFVAELLQRDHGASARDAQVLARFAEGSMDRATALARSDFLAVRGEMLKALPGLDRAAALVLADAFEAWATEQARAEVQTNAKVEENHLRRVYLKRALAMLGSVFRDAMLVASGDNAKDRLQNADAAALVSRIARTLSAETVAEAVRRFVELDGFVDRNVHNRLLLENACLEAAGWLTPLRA